MLALIKKIFGTKSDRDIKRIMPMVEACNQAFAQLKNLSDDQLRAKTLELKKIIQTDLAKIDTELHALHQKIADHPDLTVHQKEEVFEKIDALEKERNVDLEKTLLNILPTAFAVVKETARRYKENGQLLVTATSFDQEMASKKSNVQIANGQATWANKWMAAGNEVTWEMMHYDVQLIGGIVLHEGKISEMATGEGKTLVATLPAYLNALGGRGVHIVTVNDYLAKRDSEWMAPLMEFHGLRVDCIDKYEAHSDKRREAYLADITYGTNNEFGFDYLRDNMARNIEERVQRGHHYAMVDEVDSVLIDDARTPLIISGPVPKGDQHEFYDLKPRIYRVVEEQKKLINNYLVEAKKAITSGNDKEGGLMLFRAYRGFPKHKPLIKYLSEVGVRALLQKTENEFLQENMKRMPEADAPLFFTIDEKNNHVELTEKGIDFITGEGEDPHLFILPDLSIGLTAIDKNATLSEDERLVQKEKVIEEYSIKSDRIHSLNQLLKAYALFEKDTDYIIVENKVKIVDEQTGRVMEGRRYSDGLHQALEAKENVKVEDASQTYATVTLQNYFRMYHKLSGMTGTAETEAGEFMEIYNLDVVVIPTNRVAQRKDHEDKVYKTTREKFNAVAEEIVDLTQKGRPVLVGTTSVEISELLSRMLKMRNIKHQVLNAKLHAKEADIVAEAGKPSTVTIATNMAGRGTDIKLTPESKAAGGLAIIGTERHESRRVDRQLRGRSGRQGDVGSSQFFVSLEDNLMRLFGSERIVRLMDRMGLDEGEVIQHSMITNSIERAQKRVEENNFSTRKRLLEYDNVMNSQREVIYRRRKNALEGERLQLDILNIIYDLCDDLVNANHGKGGYDNFKLQVHQTFGFTSNIDQAKFSSFKSADIASKLFQELLEHYNAHMQNIMQAHAPVFKDLYINRGATIENVVIPFSDGKRQINVTAKLAELVKDNNRELQNVVEKFITLSVIDTLWIDHLREMDDLKQSVQNAVFEQKDPLLIYKFESFQLFKNFIAKVNEETISFLFKAEIFSQRDTQVVEARQEAPRVKLRENKDAVESLTSGAPEYSEAQDQPKVMPVKVVKIAGRNDRVSVKYMDGTVKKDVKYKTVEEDVENNRCIIIENE
jgi:preprotein translocase subunit SecA